MTSEGPQELVRPAEMEGQRTVDRVKREDSAARRVLGLLFLLTVLAVGLNWFDLSWKRRNQAKPHYLAFASTCSTSITVVAELNWEPRTAVEPEFFIEGRKLPCFLQVAPTEGQVRRFLLTWRVSPNCRPAAYRGKLTLTSHDTTDGGRISEGYDIELRVMGFWKQWWIVSAWFIFLALFYFVSYPFFVWWRPQPKGRLCLWASDQTTHVGVLLRPRWISWLLPWLRGVLSLGWISKEAGGIPLLNAFDGKLIFDRVYPPYPTPVLELVETWGRVRWLDTKKRQRLTPKDGRECGCVQELNDWGTLVFWDSERRTSVAAWFEHADSD